MDDGAVLGFQVEYHSLISEEDQEVIVTQLNKGKLPDDVLQQEKLLPTELYETDEHIRTMLQKIFNRRSVVKSSRYRMVFLRCQPFLPLTRLPKPNIFTGF